MHSERILQTGTILEVSVAKLTGHELQLAADICEHFDLPFGLFCDVLWLFVLLVDKKGWRIAGGEIAPHLVAREMSCH